MRICSKCQHGQTLLMLFLAAVCALARQADAGGISGKVTGPDGSTPLSDLQVTAWRTNSYIWFGTQTYTATNGVYLFNSLTAGTYRIEFNEWDNPAYAHETYDDKILLSEGSNLVVTASSVHSNINASLALASKITGHVYGPDGVTGIEGVQAWAYRNDGFFNWRRIGEFADTDATGAYSIGGLAAGAYRVEYQDSEEGNFVSQVYSNASNLDSGLDIVLPASGTVPNINVYLAQAGKISGTVLTTNGLPLADGWASPLQWNGSFWAHVDASDGFFDDQGKYTFGGLSSGTYRVEFHTENENFFDEVYDNVLEAEYGQDITVTAGSTVSNINAILDTPAWPPQILRQTVKSFHAEIAYTCTNDTVCVLQVSDAASGGWSNVYTNDYARKGVNTIWDMSPAGTTRFWRVMAP